MTLEDTPTGQNSDVMVLQVENLSIDAVTPKGVTHLVQNISFEVRENEVLGIVGESGSGKSLTMLAVLGLLGPNLKIVSGSIRLRGREVTDLSFEEMQKLRGKAMSIVFQDPLTTLNPVLRIGKQIGEAVQLHNPDYSKDQVKARVIELLTLVGMPNPEKRYSQFPNEFSGGMRQRVVIAIAMANEPDLLIADEPTTALDVTIQAQVMNVLAEVRERTGAAMVLITHDLGLVAENADRIAVMYAGRMMEEAPAKEIFERPTHPYTAGLIASLPQLDHRVEELYSIPGFVPDLSNRPSGCVFHPRCAIGGKRPPCLEKRPELAPAGEGRRVACHFHEETAAWRDEQMRKMAAPENTAVAHDGPRKNALLIAENLEKTFDVRGGLWSKQKLHALKDVSFELQAGTTLGVVGESGCGKSTLAKVMLRLLEASGGEVYLNGKKFFSHRGPSLRRARKNLQVVFQDPYSSLDPRMKIHEIIAEPLRINGGYSADRVNELLAHVGLTPEAGLRRPPEFSGGQRQRIAIARALALNPDVLILDEAVSALDVSIQAQVINLLKDLQAELNLTYVFISHDLSVVRHISDEVAVMYLGRVIEAGKVDQVFDAPAHPYTKALLDAIPKPDRDEAVERFTAEGDLPDPMRPPTGCKFRTRCPLAREACKGEDPELIARDGTDHPSACLFPLTRDAVPA
ncbi:ABC transporter ATP-binding protein [Pseudooceanicola atlanticus]|uniref:ABC transporter ATP-binding protein n=1 Tax=Pseudooceanicola atlanticus TaxID=1461694 RepID=UPI0005C1A6EA|nr:ABC transporter ATP-binding protein [Pseudooceanicola atlanticus]